MIANIIVSYLINKGKISLDQYYQFFEELSKVRAKLGLIAVHEGLMTEYQADTVNMLQATMDLKFGDLAVEKGFLTSNQVQELLRKQADPYLSVAQVLENMGIMRLNDLDIMMKKYQVENEMSASSIEALKSDDIDRIVPLFLPAEADEYVAFATLAVKTLMRCVDNNVFPIKGYFAEEVKCQNGALQFVDGDPCLTAAMCGDGNSLLAAASTFGKEDFPSVNMDALDAIAELLNCICGLYASELSLQRITMELYPPEYDDTAEGIGGFKTLVFPMMLNDKLVNLLICIGEKLEFIQI
ncbi:MAG: chemotaxis protein CheX [Lachnospiraceae bacterium]|nr:chemotaxis protein CheX [Lachnospiraceae bacterium]